MDKIPFSVYDFFSYLAAGVVVLATFDYAFCQGSALSTTPSLSSSVLVVIGAYVLGQLIAQAAGGWLERGPSKLRHVPEVALFADSADDQDSWLRKAALPRYRPLEPIIRERVIARARDAGFPLPTNTPNSALGSKALWKHCYVRVRGDAPTASRLATFSIVGDFSRNVGLASLIAVAVVIAGVINRSTGPYPGWWAAAAAIATGGLWLRHLRFRRLFHAEAYIAYAELPSLVYSGVTAT